MPFNPTNFRHTMRLWATGVTIVTAEHAGLKRGMTVSSFTSVTLDPPLILVCLQKATETADLIYASKNFAVSMLGEHHQEISNLFAGFVPLAEGQDRFEGIKLHYAETGSPILSDAMGWLDCKLHAVHDGSTHHIFIGEVLAASGEAEHHAMPLIYYNREYRRIE